MSYFLILLGVGKTSLVHLIVNGSSITRPPQTIGCTVGVKVKTSYSWSRKSLWFKTSPNVHCCFSSTLLMEILAAPQVALKVILKEISLLNSGMCQDMIVTKIAGLCFIHRLMVSNRASLLFSLISIYTSVYTL